MLLNTLFPEALLLGPDDSVLINLEFVISNHLTLENFFTSEYESWRKANRKNGKDDLRRLIDESSRMGYHLQSSAPKIKVI